MLARCLLTVDICPPLNGEEPEIIVCRGENHPETEKPAQAPYT